MTHYRPAAAVSLCSDRHHQTAVEGAGHYGAGLARFLSGRGETVLEVGRGPRGERRLRGKDDSLDAIRAARALFSSETLALPRRPSRRQHHPATRAYIERRTAEGKSQRDATRLLKRYLARHLYRVLQNQTPLMTRQVIGASFLNTRAQRNALLLEAQLAHLRDRPA